MSNHREDRTKPKSNFSEPSPAVLAEIDRLDELSKAAPKELGPQIELWKAVTALSHWVCINRGTAAAPRPYMLAGASGPILCIYTSAARANQAARDNGLVPPGERVLLFAPPLPGALDWAMSFGKYGVVGLAVDYPELGSWCPLPNLARFREMRGQA